MQLLLVEDDNLIGSGLVRALEREGYTVTWCRDGARARAVVAESRFDLVVLDLGLPMVDGMDLLRRSRGRGLVMPVLVLTARDATEDKIRGLDAGADDFLGKPFDTGELLARLRAHELRTPVTGMHIHLDNARLAAADDPDQRQSIEAAQAGASRMAHVVDQLLRFNRAVSEKETNDAEPVDLEALLQEVVQLHRPLIDQHGQLLETGLRPVRVPGNRELLGIVFGNLQANASEHTPAGGAIRVTIAEAADGPRVTVEDAGAGIPASERQRVFSRFRRGHGDRHDGGSGGCGLGLAIAERICARHGATIELDDGLVLPGLRVTVHLSR